MKKAQDIWLSEIDRQVQHDIGNWAHEHDQVLNTLQKDVKILISALQDYRSEMGIAEPIDVDQVMKMIKKAQQTSYRNAKVLAKEVYQRIIDKHGFR